jgi:hypothetical protein
MLLITTGVLPVSGTISENNNKKSSTVEIPDSYVIENVPYVSQGDSYYCIYACPTMIFQYYGINASLHEVCFNSGVGYSLGYKIIYPCFSFPGTIMSQTGEDRQFLADIYGLNYREWFCNDKSISDDMKWQMYWTKVKENISKNIPVMTEVLLENLPYIPNEPGDHMILLVGYNDTNNTVCVHDSYASVVNSSVSGSYIYISIDCIKKSINYYLYLFEIFEDAIDEPLSKTEAFELAHTRNINRMKGDANAYSKEYTLVLGHELYIFGVHALKFLKHSYNIRNILMLTISDKIRGTSYIYESAYWCYWIFYEKHNISQYLIENSDLYSNAIFDAEMLEIEANNWLLLNLTIMKLSSIPIFRLPAKMLVLKEIRDILDIIISIEKDIINSVDT